MWLLRGLSFTCKALQYAQANKTQELSVTFTTAYEETLKKFHNFVVKGVFSVRIFLFVADASNSELHAKQVAMKACPYRKDFYSKLAVDPEGGPPASTERVNEALDKWLAALSAMVAQMEAFYQAGGYGKGL